MSTLVLKAYVTPYEETSTHQPSVSTSAFTLQPSTSPSMAVASQAVVEVVTAAYPFNGVEAKHMSFAAGSTIDVLEKQEEWWRGRLKDGTTGWFPKNYVSAGGGGGVGGALVKPAKKEAKRAAPKPPGGAKSTAEAPTPVAPAAPAGVAFVAAYDFQGQESTDLSFGEGDVIMVTKQEGEWWEGTTRDGRSGIFPASFVEVQESSQPEVRTNF